MGQASYRCSGVDTGGLFSASSTVMDFWYWAYSLSTAFSWFFTATWARSSREPPYASKYARAIRAYAPGKVIPERTSQRSSAAIASASVAPAVPRLVIRSIPPTRTTSSRPARTRVAASRIATPEEQHADSKRVAGASTPTASAISGPWWPWCSASSPMKLP